MPINRTTPSPFWLVLPYSERNLVNGGHGTFLLISDRGQIHVPINDRGAEVRKFGIPIFFSKPDAFEEARRLAMSGKEVPIVCEVLAFVELPRDVKVVTKYFNSDGEIVAEDPR